VSKILQQQSADVNHERSFIHRLTTYARQHFKPTNIPPEIQPHFCWINFAYANRLGQLKKPPIDSRGYPIDPLEKKIDGKLTHRHFQSFERSIQRFHQESMVAGVGYVLTGEHRVTAVDLDHCLIDGQLTDFAKNVIRLVNSYTEISPSGSGIRILCYADPLPSVVTGDIEIYSSDRYVSVTGRKLARLPIGLMERSQAIASLVAEHKPKQQEQQPKGDTVGGISLSWADDPTPKFTDDKAFSLMLSNQKTGAALKRILETGVDPDKKPTVQTQFTGEIKVITSLIYWCNGNREQCRRIMLSDRCQMLYREKWHEDRTGIPFLDYEINRALRFNLDRGYLK